MKETKLEYIKRKAYFKYQDIKYEIKKRLRAFRGYYVREQKTYNERWYIINKNCYGAHDVSEGIDNIYYVYVNVGTFFKPHFTFLCDSSCKGDGITKAKSYLKNKKIKSTCVNKLMFTNQNTIDFHRFLLEESEK